MSEAKDYGYGLFETIRFQNMKVQNLDKHYIRLKTSAHALDISFQTSENDFEMTLLKAIKNSGIDSGRVRYQLDKTGISSQESLKVRENRYKKPMYEKGFDLCLSEVRKSSTALLAGHKTVNYLENLLVMKKARSKGYDEALYLNEKDYITEGAYTNIFFVKGSVLYTPGIASGLLPGTMRAQVIELARSKKITCLEGAFTLEDIKNAEAVFVTNALMGIMPVRKINEVKSYNINHIIVRDLSNALMAQWVY